MATLLCWILPSSRAIVDPSPQILHLQHRQDEHDGEQEIGHRRGVAHIEEFERLLIQVEDQHLCAVSADRRMVSTYTVSKTWNDPITLITSTKKVVGSEQRDGDVPELPPPARPRRSGQLHSSASESPGARRRKDHVEAEGFPHPHDDQGEHGRGGIVQPVHGRNAEPGQQ